jgi:hypothetical protein
MRRLSEGDKNMKILWAVVLALSLLLVSQSAVEAHDPYYSDELAVEYPPAYDPYYELHTIHYQLYRPRYYPVYYRPYVVSPVQVIVVNRNPRAIRFIPVTRRR